MDIIDAQSAAEAYDINVTKKSLCPSAANSSSHTIMGNTIGPYLTSQKRTSSGGTSTTPPHRGRYKLLPTRGGLSSIGGHGRRAVCERRHRALSGSSNSSSKPSGRNDSLDSSCPMRPPFRPSRPDSNLRTSSKRIWIVPARADGDLFATLLDSWKPPSKRAPAFLPWDLQRLVTLFQVHEKDDVAPIRPHTYNLSFHWFPIKINYLDYKDQLEDTVAAGQDRMITEIALNDHRAPAPRGGGVISRVPLSWSFAGLG